MSCQHEELRESVTAYGSWDWVRNDDGTYGPVGEIRVGEEDSEGFECRDCGAKVTLDHEARIEEVES